MPEPLITVGTSKPWACVTAQSMRCERGKDGLKEFTLTFTIQSSGDRVEAMIAAVAGEPWQKEKGGHLSIEFFESKTTQQGTEVVRAP